MYKKEIWKLINCGKSNFSLTNYIIKFFGFRFVLNLYFKTTQYAADQICHGQWNMQLFLAIIAKDTQKYEK